ncbi:MAG TPA: four helix bundle protein [Paludibacter sp.]|nr:four helix bundle protein [Paludibacter sp.]
MEYKYSFEKLDVWQDARKFVTEIYKTTSNFPTDEKFGLCSQLQRAAVSVVSNIAEGTSRLSDKEKIRFVEIAYGSLMEVYCQLSVSLDLQYITTEQFEINKKSIDSIAKQLSALVKAYKNRLR